MTEKDRELIDKLLEKAIKQQSELIKLQFDNHWEKLDSIHDEVKKTNGTVREHSKLIQELKEAETKHVANCPQKKDMDSLKDKLVNIEKIEVSREAVSKFSWKQVTGLGIVAGVVFGLLRILLDLLKTII